MMINNKLLGAIFGKKVKNNGFTTNYSDELVICFKDFTARNITIYELANNVKSFIVSQTGITLQSYVNKKDRGVCKIKKGDCKVFRIVSENNEALAVIKAGEWVFNNFLNKQPKGHSQDKVKD